MFSYLNETSWTPTEPFYAIRVKINGQKELHPCNYQSDANKGKYEAFIRGIGWKKAKTAELIPLFKGGLPEFKEYLETYGKYCLFYAITGKELNSDDCVVSAAKAEIISLLHYGADYCMEVSKAVNELNNRIIKHTLNQLGLTEITHRYQTLPNGNHLNAEDLFRLKVNYYIFYPLIGPPNLDPMVDDTRLFKHYVAMVRAGVYNDPEIENFPVSVKDRLTFLFGEYVANEYKRILYAYPITYNPNKDLVV